MAASKFQNSRQFKKELDQGKLGRIYLFIGEEEGEKDKFINTILDLEFRDQEDRNNYIGRFHMGTEDLLAAADFALSSSMFSEKKVCIIRDIDSIPVNNSNKILFTDIIEGMPDSTVLILTSSENRPPSIISSAQVNSIKVVHFWRYFDSDIYSYIQISVNKIGMSIDDRAIKLLLDLTGNDIKKIDEAINIFKYYGAEGVIDTGLIQDLISDVKNVSVFEYIDLLFNKDRRAFRVLKKVMDDGTSELLVLNLIIRQTETIEKYHSLIEKGESTEDAMKQCGIYSRNRDRFWYQVKNFPVEKVRKIFPLISEADYSIKSTRFSKSPVSNPVFDLTYGILFSV